jgi:polyhydroxybutyrate depolymerase
MRTYSLFVPTTVDPSTPAPLVVNFHGLYGTPELQMETSQFDVVAEPRGMLVAYPAGIGSSFNAGACCGTAQSEGVDDVAFARALVEQISTEQCVDPQRVYATGMSNGGHMAHTLGCEAADVFAAVASVTGVLGLDPASCTPSRPISVLDFHGTGDLIVPYDGGGPGYPAVPEMMAGWAARNGCTGASESTLVMGAVSCETWPDCEGGVEVTLCTIDGGGHCWPGDPVCLFGTPNTDVSASEMIATMFDAQTLP